MRLVKVKVDKRVLKSVVTFTHTSECDRIARLNQANQQGVGDLSSCQPVPFPIVVSLCNPGGIDWHPGNS